ncbi:MAG TPA: hypothetical protein EYP81_03025, partial [Thermodesulfobacteriaceae bacterium]|nr:hypothetical protein [Thermodesulfobacteriaceae bacterium]
MLKWFRRKKEEAPGTQPERAPDKTPLSEPISKPQQETKKNLWQKFKDGLSKTRERLKDSLGELFEIDRLVDQAFLEELEEILITADIGIETVNRLLEPSRKKVLT